MGSVALVVAAASASHFGGEFSDMPALGLSTPVPNIIAKLGRRNDRVLLAPYHHLAYCNLPKAASSTVTTYMTGLNVNIHKFSDVEQFIIDRGGDSHFAMTQYSTFHEAGLEHWRNSSAPQYRYFTVVRHPGKNPSMQSSSPVHCSSLALTLTTRIRPQHNQHRHTAVQHVVR